MVEIDKNKCEKLNEIGIPAEWEDFPRNCKIDFSRSNLEGSDFSGSDLSRSNFNNSHLVSSNFNNSNFSNSNLSNSNFYHSNLRGAKFSFTDLKEANFSYADLEGAEINEDQKDKIKWTDKELNSSFSSLHLRKRRKNHKLLMET